MYNRYIPQSDGTYQRSRVEDKMQEYKNSSASVQDCPATEPTPTKCDFPHSPQKRSCPNRTPNTQMPRGHRKQEVQNTSLLSFFRQIFPKNFDTSDLLIVLLLLIISGDCSDDQNTALLTLVLYLFL